MVDGVRMDLGKMMAQKDTAVSGLTKGIEGLFKKYKACFSRIRQLPAFSKGSLRHSCRNMPCHATELAAACHEPF